MLDPFIGGALVALVGGGVTLFVKSREWKRERAEKRREEEKKTLALALKWWTL
jgi:hypothetical protein